jgi:dTDP-4-amino-4,6-dideoxygalactose transaminase
VIPIARPDLGPEEIEAVAEVLSSGMIAQGRCVEELEERWAERVGVRHAIAVTNGTVALMSILTGLGLGPGDEAITVAHTFAATVNAILFTGATPIFVDVEPDTYLIDVRRIEAAITPRTRVIVPVHLFGLVAEMDAIVDTAERHGLAIVEDAAQAHDAAFNGRKAGSFGHGAFSLYATKNMTTAEGGLVTTDDDRLADWLRVYRNQGMRSRYQFEMLGFNFRLTDVAAAIGLIQLDKLDRNTRRRQEIAAAFDAAFADLPVATPVTPTGRTHVFHQYVLRVGPARDAVLAEVRRRGVGAEVYYPVPVHRQPYIRERGLHAELPETDDAAATTLALPIFPGLTVVERDLIIGAVRAAVASNVQPTAEAIGNDGVREGAWSSPAAP